jgi:hypothetical protein
MPNLKSFNRKKLIIEELEEAGNALHAPVFLLWLDKQAAETQSEVSGLMLGVSLLHAKMVNAALAEIVDQMDANAEAIEDAIRSLDDAIVTLNKEIEMIKEIASFVNIIKPFFALI